MMWLLALIGVIYAALALGLYHVSTDLFRRHPEEHNQDARELLAVYGIMLGALVLTVGGAWIVTGRALRPLQSMLETADQIRAGRLDQRLDPPIATDELGHLARNLNHAFDSYQRLLERVDRFNLDAAHQLRNPLAAMQASAEVCLQQPRSAEEYVETLGRLLEEARRLGHTVEQLLLLARLSRDLPSEAFEVLDFAGTLQALTQALRPAFEEREIQFSVIVPGQPVRLRGLPRLLEQAVANLLDNALRLTARGGKVEVRLEEGGGKAERIRLSVADSGPGYAGPLPEGRRSGMRPDPANGSTNAEGTGLGLMIVGNIVQAHQGTVRVSVSDWGGACFTLELPGE
jgi:signal transduction histidine kinase